MLGRRLFLFLAATSAEPEESPFERVYFPEGIQVSNDFTDALPMCHHVARLAELGPLIGGEGSVCFAHEMEHLRGACAQFHCILNYAQLEMTHCRSLLPLGGTSEPCVRYMTKILPITTANFRVDYCAGRYSLASLFDTYAANFSCAHLKRNFYMEIDEQIQRWLVFVFTGMLNKTFGDSYLIDHKYRVDESAAVTLPGASLRQCRWDRLGFIKQMSRWAEMLGLLWSQLRSLEGNAAQAWPQFHLPPWCIGDHAAQALIEVTAAVRQGSCVGVSERRLVYIESGVLLADSSAEMIATFGSILGEVHLVDPWDCNDVLRNALRWKRIDVEQCAEVVRLVREKMESLPGVSVCDIHSDGNCCSGQKDCVSVFLHQMLSSEAAALLAVRKPVDLADVIFIDGAHDFKNVRADLAAWWPKLRPGGALVGHDFSLHHPGVRQAVSDFALTMAFELGSRLDIYLDGDSIFWLRKPCSA